MKNWIFKTFFPEEYKIINELIEEELDETAYVRSAVEVLNEIKEIQGEDKFREFWSSQSDCSFVGVIPHNYGEILNAKIAELEQNSKNIPK